MRFLLTNDDGISAPGLAALQHALTELGELTVVAPKDHHSGCSHRVSTDAPVEVSHPAPGQFAVHGTPADCTRLGLLHFAQHTKWVMSGINDGGNLGVDTFMSGTVAAVREGVLFGVPGIAFSQYSRREAPIDWDWAAQAARRVAAELCSQPLEPGMFWNVNLPDPSAVDGVPEIVYCPLDVGHHSVRYEEVEGRYHYRGIYHERNRTPGSDVDVCFSGQIAVTKIRLAEIA